MELCTTDLYTIKNEKIKNRFPEDIVIHIAKKIIQGFLHLHQDSIIYRDLKLENILVNLSNENLAKIEQGQVEYLKLAEFKLSDFGISKVLKDHDKLTKTSVGSPNTMGIINMTNYFQAPEIHEEKYYSFEADMYSLGCVLFELITGSLPFSISVFDIPRCFQQEINFGQASISENFKQTIKSMLKYDQKQRLQWKDLFKNQLFIDIQPQGQLYDHIKPVKRQIKILSQGPYQQSQNHSQSQSNSIIYTQKSQYQPQNQFEMKYQGGIIPKSINEVPSQNSNLYKAEDNLNSVFQQGQTNLPNSTFLNEISSKQTSEIQKKKESRPVSVIIVVKKPETVLSQKPSNYSEKSNQSGQNTNGLPNPNQIKSTFSSETSNASIKKQQMPPFSDNKDFKSPYGLSRANFKNQPALPRPEEIMSNFPEQEISQIQKQKNQQRPVSAIKILKSPEELAKNNLEAYNTKKQMEIKQQSRINQRIQAGEDSTNSNFTYKQNYQQRQQINLPVETSQLQTADIKRSHQQSNQLNKNTNYLLNSDLKGPNFRSKEISDVQNNLDRGRARPQSAIRILKSSEDNANTSSEAQTINSRKQSRQ